MRESGFVPFSAVGIVLLMLVVSIVGHGAWLRHQSSLATVEEMDSTQLLMLTISVQNDLRALARHAVYRALWEVSKKADQYGNEVTRRSAIERLAAERFSGMISNLPDSYPKRDARIELEIRDLGAPVFDLREGEGGYVLANVGLRGTGVKVRSWDNGLVLRLPCENFGAFVDSRYFLLQERMDRFVNGIRGLDGVGSRWWAAEYSTAWLQALGGKVRLSEKRSRTFFELAWAHHEHDTFGSADYPASSVKVSELGDETPLNFENAEMAFSMRVPRVETMSGYIDSCIGSIDSAESELHELNERIARALSHARENPENPEAHDPSPSDVKQELNGAIESLSRARIHLEGVSGAFGGLLEYLRMENDELAEGLTESNGAYPALAKQVLKGVEGIDGKFIGIENSLRTCLKRVEENPASMENLLVALNEEIEARLRELLTTSGPELRLEYEYPGPESHAHEPGGGPKKICREIGVFTIDGPNASLGILRTVLVSARKDFERMRSLAKITDELREGLGNVSVDSDLEQKLMSESSLGSVPSNRERMYEILPPPPIEAHPGLSVFHDFHITDVSYKRQDPLGWVNESAPPTPIPLWSIGLQLYWAEWEISLEIDGAVEEIFDFDNPVLPREHSLPLRTGEHIVQVHKPLAYRYEVPKRRFSFILLILMPWKRFTIETPEVSNKNDI